MYKENQGVDQCRINQGGGISGVARQMHRWCVCVQLNIFCRRFQGEPISEKLQLTSLAVQTQKPEQKRISVFPTENGKLIFYSSLGFVEQKSQFQSVM